MSNDAVRHMLHLIVPGLGVDDRLNGRTIAYVGSEGVRYRDGNLSNVYTGRRKLERYAVTAIVVPREGMMKYVVIDLLQLVTLAGKVLTNGHNVFGTEDAAIAAAQLKL